MTAPKELRTARLFLRSFQRDDIPAVVRLAGAKEIAEMTLRIPHPYTEKDGRNFLASARKEFKAGRSAIFAISLSATNELCGAVGLEIAEERKSAELGYWIGIPYWGRGYATEAAGAVMAFGFGTLPLNRIYAHHFAGNAASRRVLEKIGMRHEGQSPGHVRKMNRVIDLENYGLLAEKFRGGK